MGTRYVVTDDKTGKEIPQGIPYFRLEYECRPVNFYHDYLEFNDVLEDIQTNPHNRDWFSFRVTRPNA